jgi:hypothetical protein
MKWQKCKTLDYWLFGKFKDDELNLIFTGMFLWNADDAAEKLSILREFQKG